MKRILWAVMSFLLVTACTAQTITEPASPPPRPSSQTEGRCGDGICDGPENPVNCAADCAETPPPTGDVAGENVYWVTNATSGAQLYVEILHPRDWDGSPLPTLVLVPGGSGDSNNFTGQPPKAQMLADRGFTIVVFDPDGRGHSEGTEDDNGTIHQDGLGAVIQFIATLPEVDAEQIGLVSYSYGITMASGTLVRHPDLPIRFLIDWEGPANRDDTGGCDEDRVGHLQGHPCDDEGFWVEREAATFALHLPVPYQRLQSEDDHAQPDNDHALLMIANATAQAHGGHGQAPWTRLNDLPPNTVYTADDNPSMLPNDISQNLETLVANFALELFVIH